MSKRVLVDQIEEIVGALRHETEHTGRAVSAEQTVYILHSRECLDSTPDLRDCPFSLAMDRGIGADVIDLPDRPLRLAIRAGHLAVAVTGE